MIRFTSMKGPAKYQNQALLIGMFPVFISRLQSHHDFIREAVREAKLDKKGEIEEKKSQNRPMIIKGS